MVEDSLLENHLSHWGIDMMKQQKYERTMQECENDLNAAFEIPTFD